MTTRLDKRNDNSHKNLYYPYRDRALANRIMNLFYKNDFLTTNEIATKLSEKNPYPHKRINHAMKRLADLYCNEYVVIRGPKHTDCNTTKDETRKYFTDIQNIKYAGKNLNNLIRPMICEMCKRNVFPNKDMIYKIIKESRWSLSTNGKIAMLVLLDRDELRGFIEKYATGNKTLKMLQVLLQSQRKEHAKEFLKTLCQSHELDLDKYSTEWYDHMKKMIINWNINNDMSLQEYKKSLELENTGSLVWTPTQIQV